MILAWIIYLCFLLFLTFLMFLLFLELFLDVFGKKVPYVRSETKSIQIVLENINPEQGQILYDFGAGDGKFLNQLTKKFPNIKAVGFEKSPGPYLYAKLLKLFRPNRKYKILFKNFYKIDISKVDYVYCFLYPHYMKNLISKFESELKPGAIVISNTFPIKQWAPIKTISIKNSKPTSNWGKIFIYQR